MANADDAFHAGLDKDVEKFQKDFRVFQTKVEPRRGIEALRDLLLVPRIDSSPAGETGRAREGHHRFAVFDRCPERGEQFKRALAAAVLTKKPPPRAAGFRQSD